MSESKKEVSEKLDAAREQLDATLNKRAAAEHAVSDAESALQHRREELQAILHEEGKLRGIIGDLEKMGDSLDAGGEVSDT